MSLIKVHIRGYNKVKTNVMNIPINGINGLTRGMDDAAVMIKNDANKKLYDTVVEGHSESRPYDSIKYNWDIQGPTVHSGYVDVVVGNYSKHSAYVEYGTGIYSELGGGGLIIPKHSPFLRFIMDGEEWQLPYSKGQHPKAYFRNATIMNCDKIRREISEPIKQTIKGGVI